jgi:hypothetical protein
MRLRSACALVLVAACFATGSCGPSRHDPAPSDGQVITGNERFGWDQAAADVAELASFGYAVYLDGVRTEAVDVSCGTTATAAGFPCTCRLPAMSVGAHTLQVAAFVVDGATIRESERSPAVQVTRQ